MATTCRSNGTNDFVATYCTGEKIAMSTILLRGIDFHYWFHWSFNNILMNSIARLQSHVYGNCRFKIEKEQIKTVQNNSYFVKSHVRVKLGRLVQLHVCRLQWNMVRVNLSNIISVPAFLKLAIGNIDSLLKIATIAYFSLVKVKNKNDSKFMKQSLVSNAATVAWFIINSTTSATWTCRTSYIPRS